MKVSDILADYSDPLCGISLDVAERVAGEIRRLICLDLDECDIAVQVQIYNAEVCKDELQAAWWLLRDESRVRTAWKKYLDYETWLKFEKLKNAD